MSSVTENTGKGASVGEGWWVAGSYLKKAIEEASGRRWWDLTMGFMRIIWSLSWRIERTCSLGMCGGSGIRTTVLVDELRTAGC